MKRFVTLIQVIPVGFESFLSVIIYCAQGEDKMAPITLRCIFNTCKFLKSSKHFYLLEASADNCLLHVL